MPSINVLSLTGQKRTAESGDSAAGKDSTTMDGKSAAAEFAAIFGGLMFPLFGSKEQISEETKARMMEQQASPYTVSPATIAGTLGLELQKVLTDAMELSQNEVLQSKSPAGMDANSGLTRNQVNDRIIADLTTILKDVSSFSELAQYKETIAKLWQELSGKIETFSSRIDQIKTILPADLQQIQQALSGLNGSISQTVNPRDLTAIQTGLMVNNSKTAMVTPELEGTAAGLKDTLAVQSLPNRNTDLKFEEKAQGIALDLKGRKFAELALESKDAPAVKRDQNTGVLGQNAQSGNIEVTTPGGVKFAPVPIWEQISSFLRSQFLQRSSEANRDIKEFAIQLHPAELGKIQVFLRWEDGQVHLQLRAVEQATGNILQNHLSDLRQSLQDSGVTCGLLQMGLGGEQRQTPQQDQKGQTFNRDWPAEEEKAGFGEIPYSLLFEQGEQHRINFTA